MCSTNPSYCAMVPQTGTSLCQCALAEYAWGELGNLRLVWGEWDERGGRKIHPDRQYGFYHIPRGKGGAGPYDGRKLQGWQWMTLTVALISFCSARGSARVAPGLSTDLSDYAAIPSRLSYPCAMGH